MGALGVSPKSALPVGHQQEEHFGGHQPELPDLSEHPQAKFTKSSDASLQYDVLLQSMMCQGQVSAEGILHLVSGTFKGGGGNGRGGIPHVGERYNVCPRWCRDTRTVTQVRHHLLC